MAPVDAQNSAIPGDPPPQKMGEDLSRMRPNRHVRFHADRLSSGWEVRNRKYKKEKREGTVNLVSHPTLSKVG